MWSLKAAEPRDHIAATAGCSGRIETPVYATMRVCKHKPNVTQAQGNIRKMSERQKNNSPIILMNRSGKQTVFMFIFPSGLGGDKCQGWNV